MHKLCRLSFVQLQRLRTRNDVIAVNDVTVDAVVAVVDVVCVIGGID